MSMDRKLAQRLTAKALSLVKAGGRQFKIKIDKYDVFHSSADTMGKEIEEASSSLFTAAYNLARVSVWLKEGKLTQDNPAAAKMATEIDRAFKAIATAKNKIPMKMDIEKVATGGDPFKYENEAKDVRKKAIAVLVERLPELIEEYYDGYYSNKRRYDEPCADIGLLRDDIWHNRNWGDDINDLFRTKEQTAAVKSALTILKRQGKVAHSEGMGKRGKSTKCYEPPESVLKKLEQKYG